MGKKKHQFINKKTAQNFTVVHRSQRDPLQADEESTQHVLVPTACSNSVEEDTVENEAQEDIVNYGIYFDDDYDYTQHLKVRGEGTIYLADPVKETKPVGNVKVKLPDEVLPSKYEEDIGMLNLGVLPRGPQPDWDPDIVAALDDDVEFDDPDNFLTDDFISIANAPMSEESYREVNHVDDDEWVTDFEDNFSDVGSEDLGSDDFSDDSGDETKSRFTNYSMTSSVIRRTEGLKILDDRFDKIMEEYDEEELGAVEHEEVSGVFNVNNTLVEHIVDTYIDSRKLHDISQIEHDDERNDINETGKEEIEEYDESDLFAQFEKPAKSEWDCESVISTYSNIYNHPKVLDGTNKKIELHKRTGVPVDVFVNKNKDIPVNVNDNNVYKPITLNNIRSKNESLEEKKQRKQEVKSQRKNRRTEKKTNKMIFKNELKKQEKISLNSVCQKECLSCADRVRNCSLCLNDGECGFCDSCGDHCHQSKTLHSLENCTGCAQCIPGTLIGPKKGYLCRPEWYYYEKCPEVVSEKKTVYVGIALYLMNLHSVDMKAGTFHADFYLYFKVPSGQTLYTKQKCKNENLNGACFDLLNAAGSAEVSLHEGKYFRVKGKFNFAADLSNFPFDNQTLKIEIQDMEMTAKELRWKLLEDVSVDNHPFKFKSGISPTLNYTGWVFDSYSWSQIVYERYNPFLDEGVSRYAFRFHMARPKRAAFFKIFLPPLFIVIVICFAFAIPPSDATMRVWIDGNLLVSCVMFHSTMSEQAPDTQDATMADTFLLGVYGFIFVSFMVSIVLLKLQRKKLFRAAESFYRYAEWMVWFTAPTYFLLLYYIRIPLHQVLVIVLVLALSVAGGIKACTYIKPTWFSYQKIPTDAESASSDISDEALSELAITKPPSRKRTKYHYSKLRHSLRRSFEYTKNSVADDPRGLSSPNKKL